MTPAPHRIWQSSLRRRPSFWLGLFVACFLAWAWWDSYRNEALFSLWTGKLQVVRGEGGTHFASGGQITGFMPGYFTHRGKPMGIWFWKQMWQSEGHSYAMVPDTLVFFSFVGLWAGWLAWPARVERKAARLP